MSASLAERVARLPAADRQRLVELLPQSAATALLRSWRGWWARPEQLAPGSEGAALSRSDWTFWLLLAGRMFGKTRSGAEWAIEKARALPGSKGHLVAATADEARKVMLSAGLEGTDGASGILAISAPDFRPRFEPSKRVLTWPNGTVAELFSAEEPDRLRGPQCHWAWVDEVAAWARHGEAWDQMLFGLRLGARPQACITTTPRPIAIVRQLLANPDAVVTRGRSRENASNVAPAIFSTILRKFEGTRIGRQELDGELLEDVQGALWRLSAIDALRVELAPELLRVVIAIDPAVSNTEGSDETGIVVAGVAMCGCKGPGKQELHGFVLADLSGKRSPNEWARLAIDAVAEYQADRVVAEVNQGGDLVEANLRTVDRNVSYTAVHAAKGKRSRAEPIAALYEQGKVHHVGGAFAKLEDQLCTWEPLGGQRSPDRLDALVWAFTDLLLTSEETTADLWARAAL